MLIRLPLVRLNQTCGLQMLNQTRATDHDKVIGAAVLDDSNSVLLCGVRGGDKDGVKELL